MKQYQFREWEFSEKAYDVYCNSSFVFYRDGVSFYLAENQACLPLLSFSSKRDVEEFLLEFAD